MDRHCHILPGVDDGVETMEEALELIRRMKAVGLKGAYCTPHIMQRFPNTVEALQARFAELTRHAEGLDFTLKLAAEYMIDEEFDTILKKGPLLTWDDKHLLVELPQYLLPTGWMDSISLLLEQGYTPVLAHPERYIRILSIDDLLDLSDLGILFQGNIGAITGYYGTHVQKTAQHLRKLNLYHCWGSDAHDIQMFNRATKL